MIRGILKYFLLIIALPVAALLYVFILRAQHVKAIRQDSENLVKIEAAKVQYLLEYNCDPSITPTKEDLLTKTKCLKSWPRCPFGGEYEIRDLDHGPRCTHPERKPSLLDPVGIPAVNDFDLRP